MCIYITFIDNAINNITRQQTHYDIHIPFMICIIHNYIGKSIKFMQFCSDKPAVLKYFHHDVIIEYNSHNI